MSGSRKRWPRRGEVYAIDFGPPRGHELAGTRPCLVVQNDVGNQYSGVTIVAIITGNLKVAALPIGVFVKRASGAVWIKTAWSIAAMCTRWTRAV
jgi:mRNA interferase MazF